MRTTLLTALTALLIPATALADTPAAGDAGKPRIAKKKHVTAELVADVDRVAPGETFRVGVRYELSPHWHIYWIEPGEAGQPTRLSLHGPDGWDLGAIQWPTPKYFKTGGGIEGYGYEDEVLLFADVKVPADALEGDSVTFEAQTKWLVCEKSCIPGRANLSLTLPIATAHKAGGGHEHAKLFDRFAAQVPGPAPAGLQITKKRSVSGVQPGDVWELVVAVQDLGGAKLDKPEFYVAAADGLNVMSVTVSDKGPHVPKGGYHVRIAGKASEDAQLTGEQLTGILLLKKGGEAHNIAVDATIPRLAEGRKANRSDDPVFAVSAAPEEPKEVAEGRGEAGDGAAAATGKKLAPADKQGDGEDMTFLLALLFAFLGGVILNGMPCVLPVLSIKVLALVEQSSQSPAQIRRHGYAYTLGVMLSFAAMTGVMVAAGKAWGFAMQSAYFNATLAAVTLAFALSLFGVFEVQLPGANRMNAKVAHSSGYASSFFYGVFAVALATPCVAPFLAPAIGFALTLPPLEQFVLLQAVAVGLAAPFLLLALFPQWAKLMPKPGPWMLTFKKIMGFLLIGTAVWIISFMKKQVSPDSMVLFLAFLAVVAFATWVYGHWGSIMRPRRTRLIALVTSLVLIGGGAWAFMDLKPPPPAAMTKVQVAGAPPLGHVSSDNPPVKGDDIQWRDFKTVDPEALSNHGQTVFMDFTADWCATCKLYEASVIDTDEVRGVLASMRVVPVKADWTNEDEEITSWLKRFKRAGVPMYVILPAGRPHEPILLPDLLTTEHMLNGLKKAGPSQPATTVADSGGGPA